MSNPAIRTVDDVAASVPWNLPYHGSLEDYLRTLWGLVQQHRDEPVSWALIGHVLTEAFAREPVPFDPDWLRYDAPPLREELPNPYEYLKHMLLYQIADLHRMRQAGTLNLSPVILYGGVVSPTGYRWYNFSTQSYFECAFAGAGSDEQEATWADLAELLYLGQIYE